MMKFIFNLNVILKSPEILLLISRHFNLSRDIQKINRVAIRENIPFIENFLKQIFVLKSLPVNEINKLLKEIVIYPQIFSFIKNNKTNCVIVSKDLDCWTKELIKKVECPYYSSKADIFKNKVTKITQIIKKEDIVRQYQNLGEKVVFIGNGTDDMEAMRIADISITCGLHHKPAKNILNLTNYLIFKEESLCRQLNQLS